MPEEPLYREGSELRVITSNRLHYGGCVLRCSGDWITILDRVKGRPINLNIHLLESVEVLSKIPPERDRDSPGRLW